MVKKKNLISKNISAKYRFDMMYDLDKGLTLLLNKINMNRKNPKSPPDTATRFSSA